MIRGIRCSRFAQCVDDKTIDDFINNILIEMRVIYETMDYSKYN